MTPKSCCFAPSFERGQFTLTKRGQNIAITRVRIRAIRELRVAGFVATQDRHHLLQAFPKEAEACRMIIEDPTVGPFGAGTNGIASEDIRNRFADCWISRLVIDPVRRSDLRNVSNPRGYFRSASIAVRHVWIFDNHPTSLRLLSETLAKDDVDLELPRNPRPLILGMALILTLVIAMFWPLFVR